MDAEIVKKILRYSNPTLEEKINILPEEIINKIFMYSHPTFDEQTKNLIHNYSFNFSLYNYNNNNRFCTFCERNHRIPMHFRCRT